MDNEEHLAIKKAMALSLPYASIQDKVLRMERGQDLHRLVPRSFAEENAVLPLFRDGGKLLVATPHCDDTGLLAELARRTGLTLVPFVAARTQVLKAIAEAYGSGC